METETEQVVDAADLMGSDEPAAEVKAKPKVAKKSEGMPKRVKIWLEENDDIPPTGLPISHNGNSFIIVPGEPVEVPEYLLDILDNAVLSVGVTDPQTRQVVGYRDRLRFPYRRL